MPAAGRETKRQQSDLKGERAIAFVLRYGALISALVMATGIVLAVFGGTPVQPAADHFIRPKALFSGLFHLEPIAVTEFGVLLLLFTPIVRIVVAVVGFAMERDLKYVLISLGVLAVVLLSISFAIEA